jgi:hypothetical protein
MDIRKPVVLLLLVFSGLLAAGCQQDLDVGSDVMWTARFERGDLGEWTGVDGGAVAAFPAPNVVEVSSERVFRGAFAARLTIQTTSDGAQANAGLTRSGFLPVEGYYSAWYYLPRTINVGNFWVIFKFRMRTNADDSSTEDELFDLDLTNSADGGMSLRLYDHRSGDIPLAVAAPAVPVATWFQIEAFYRNVLDSSGRLTIWLDGRPIVDVTDRPMAPTPWVAWDVVSVAANLNPSTAVLYVDDCALSRTRVGPTGLLARP